MNRARLLENLIYLIVTSVQVCLLTCVVFANPNLNPPTPTFPKDSTEPSNTESTKTESSKNESNESSKANLDSLIISDPNTNPSTPTSPSFLTLKKNRISLAAGLYLGPNQELKSKSIMLWGIDYQHPVNYSLWNHIGFAVGNGANPFIYVSQEHYLRNFWKFLKSWQYLMQLELDTKQGLGALVSFNYYMLGAGLSLELFENTELLLSAYPLSTRGLGAEVKIKYLTF